MDTETKDIRLMRHAIDFGVEVAPQLALRELHFLAMASTAMRPGLAMQQIAHMARLEGPVQ